MGIVFIIKERNLVPKLVRQTNMFNRREKIIKKEAPESPPRPTRQGAHGAQARRYHPLLPQADHPQDCSRILQANPLPAKDPRAERKSQEATTMSTVSNLKQTGGDLLRQYGSRCQ